MRISSNKIRILLAILIISFLPIQSTQGALYISYSSSERESPIVDGNIDGSPWNVSGNDLKLYDLSNQDNYINVDFKSIYNDTDETVSIGLKIPTTESDDIFIITFATVNLLSLVAHGLPWRFNEGNDQKVFNLQDETIIDRKTNGVDLGGTSDVSVGGSIDFDCKATYDGSHYNVEFSAPQYSYDLLGKDFNLKRFNSTEFFVWYYDDSTQTTYSQILEANVSRDYCYLKIGRVTLTIDSLLLVGSIASTLLLVASVRLSKRKKINKKL